MSDTITITLPVAKTEVVLRNYTTHEDDDAYEQQLFENVYSNELGESKVPGNNSLKAKRVYVRRLVDSIDGSNEDIPDELKRMRTIDYDFVEKQVDKIVKDNSPKE